MKRLAGIFRSRWFVTLIICVWVFVPEIRRYVDWRSTFHALSVLSILPLLSLTPGIFILANDWKLEGVGFRRVTALWLIAFGYAFVFAVLLKSYASSTYSLLQFCLPLVFGALLNARRDWCLADVYNWLADSMLVVVTLSALYGIYQFASPPPWDTYWAQQANIEGSQGATVAFGFRIFGTLNSTGPFAFTLLVALLLNLPRLSLKRWYVAVGFVPIVIALALTSVRTAWLGLAIGIVCYVLLAASRRKVLISFAAVVLIIVVAGAVITGTVKEAGDSVTSLSDRFSTLSSLENDKSANERASETADAYALAREQPLGLGLGVIGTAAKLSGEGATVVLDNGYLARLVELGFTGFLFYLASVFAALVFAVRTYGIARRMQDHVATDIMAVVVAIQVVYIFLEAATDTYSAFSGMFFWAVVGIASRYSMGFGRNMRQLPDARSAAFGYGGTIAS